MNKKDLVDLKKTLIQKKIELLNKTGNISGNSDISSNENPGDEIDVASQSIEKEIYFELAANDKITLSAIKEALTKIEKNVYGRCECCNGVIQIKRLAAIPWTRYCIRCQEEAENKKR